MFSVLILKLYQIIQNNNEDQGPMLKENPHTTKMIDTTNCWTTVNNNTKMHYNNNKMEENKKDNEKIEMNNECKKQNSHYDLSDEDSDDDEEEGSDDESGELERSNAKQKDLKVVKSDGLKEK